MPARARRFRSGLIFKGLIFKGLIFRGLIFKGLIRDRSEGNQLVELAVSLPLLVVLVVGIFDFGNAYNLKQKLNSAVREGARFGSSLPTSDLANGGVPPSVTAVKDLVDDHLTAAGINDCGLNAVGGAASGTLLWTFTASGNGCPGTLTLTIDRSCCATLTANIGASQPVSVISTHVSISYAYAWQFGHVAGLLSSNGFRPTTTQLTTDALIPNMD